MFGKKRVDVQEKARIERVESECLTRNILTTERVRHVDDRNKKAVLSQGGPRDAPYIGL